MMAKKYKFQGAIFTDPTIKTYSFTHSFETGLTTVDCHISDKDDSVSLTIETELVPDNFKENGLEKLVLSVMDLKHKDSK